ncbi:MAG: Ig-like domain repeat protein, partial [Acidobacteria bacterium]|nr:Ig-like domain repeat protein [Acidobacteriota bacterium]
AYTTSSLTVGSHTITATYNGANYASGSGSANITVSQ